MWSNLLSTSLKRGDKSLAASHLAHSSVFDGLLDEYQDNGDWGGNWYARDLAYGSDTLVENLAGERAETGKKKGAALNCVGALRRLNSEALVVLVKVVHIAKAPTPD